MNRRNFLTDFLTGVTLCVTTPQIVTHGLGLKIPKKKLIVHFDSVDVVIRSVAKLIAPCSYCIEDVVEKVNFKIPREHLIPYKTEEPNGIWVYKNDAVDNVILSEFNLNPLYDMEYKELDMSILVKS